MFDALRRALAGMLWLSTLLLAHTADAQVTYTWTGQVSTVWSVAQNWTPVGVPANGDSLIFPDGPANRSLQNDLPIGLVFERIVFNGGNYNLNGNGLTIRTQFSGAGGATAINLPLTVEAGRTIEFGTSQNFVNPMRFNTGISGSGTLNLVASNKVWIAANSTFSGTMTSTGGGRLLLNGANLPSMQMSNISVYGWGQIGTGNNAALFPSSAFEFINLTGTGTAELRTASLTQTTNGFWMEVNGPVAATNHDIVRVTGSLSITGVSLTVTGVSTYRPALNQQIVLFDNDGADAVVGTFSGRAEASTFVLNGATWRLSYVGGTGNDIVLTCIDSPKVWSGAVDAQWSTPGNWLGGAPVSGDSLIFPAGAANKTNTNNMAAGFSVKNMTIQEEGYQIGGNQLVPTGTIHFSAPANSAEIQFPINVTSPTVLRVIGGGGTSADLHLSGSLSGNGSIIAAGGGVLRLTGTHPYTGTLSSPCSGGCTNLFFDNATLASTNINASGAIWGRGQIRDLILAGGYIFPSSEARLNSFSPMSFGVIQTRNVSLSSTAVNIDISGVIPGSQHGQLSAAGTVTLGSSVRLNTRLGPLYRPNVGDVIRIVDNDGTDVIVGTFNNLAQGATVYIDGAEFSISYTGGTGNDITLTCTNSRKVWTGAVNNLWSNAGNWLGGVPQNGDSAAFPPGAAPTLTTENDLPADRQIRTIWTGRHITLTGQRVALQSRLASENYLQLSMPLDLGNRAIVFNASSSQLIVGAPISGSGSITQSSQQFTYRGTQPYSGTLLLGPPGGAFGLAVLDNVDAPAMQINSSGGWLQGRGTISHLSSSGTLGLGVNGSIDYPNNGAGALAAGNIQLTGGTVHLGLDGVIAGVSYDQLRSTGTVAVSGTNLTLYLAASHVPAIGQQYRLIDNDGSDAISGTFTNLANGATVVISGYQFQANYAGGTGNDLVLTALNGRPASATTLTSNINPSGTGQTVNLTATVTGVGVTPTGSVVFRDGLTTLGTGILSGGVATWVGSFPAVGTFTLTAEYGGDAALGGSASAGLVQQVIPRYTLTYGAGTGGSVAGSTTQQVNQGGSGTQVTATPAVGYRFVQWSDGVLSAARTESNVQASLSVSAQFALQQHAVTPNLPSNGSVSPASVQMVNHGSTTAFTLSPIGGYRIGSVSGCNGNLIGNVYTTGAITGPCSVTVAFNRNPVASNGSLNVVEDGPETPGTLVGNDDDALTYNLLTPPSKGTISQFNASTGAYRYTPTANANGADSFSFSVSDAGATSAAATVSIAIAPVNDPPTITIADPSIEHAAATVGAILDPAFAVFSTGPANEVGQFIESLTIASLDDPDGVIVPGSLVVNLNGRLSYTLTGEGGTVTVQFRVQDTGGTSFGGQNQSALASFTVFVPFSADLQVAKTNLQDGVLENEQVLYSLVAANAGPDPVSSVRVRDLDPSGLGNMSFACNAALSSIACPLACTGSGLLDCTVALAAGQHVRIDVLATVTAPAGSNISNSAVVSVLSPEIVSLVSANDSATDEDLVRTEGVFHDGFESTGNGLTVSDAVKALGER